MMPESNGTEEPKKQNKVVGYVKVQEIRGEFEPNYKVFILAPTKLNDEQLGEFDADKWDYSYLFDARTSLGRDDFVIYEINEAQRLPRKVRVFREAIREVMKEEWNGYEMLLRSSKGKESIEWEIGQWLGQEGHPKASVWVISLPRIKTEKRIPITEDMFEKMIGRGEAVA